MPTSNDLITATLAYCVDDAIIDWILERTEERDDEDARCVLTDDSRPIVVERWEHTGSAWLNFELAQVRIGVYLPPTDKPGVEVDILGTPLNEGAAEIITLADLRQIYSDLGALLADDRLLGALAEQEHAA